MTQDGAPIGSNLDVSNDAPAKVSFSHRMQRFFKARHLSISIVLVIMQVITVTVALLVYYLAKEETALRVEFTKNPAGGIIVRSLEKPSMCSILYNPIDGPENLINEISFCANNVYNPEITFTYGEQAKSACIYTDKYTELIFSTYFSPCETYFSGNISLVPAKPKNVAFSEFSFNLKNNLEIYYLLVGSYLVKVKHENSLAKPSFICKHANINKGNQNSQDKETQNESQVSNLPTKFTGKKFSRCPKDLLGLYNSADSYIITAGAKLENDVLAMKLQLKTESSSMEIEEWISNNERSGEEDFKSNGAENIISDRLAIDDRRHVDCATFMSQSCEDLQISQPLLFDYITITRTNSSGGLKTRWYVRHGASSKSNTLPVSDNLSPKHDSSSQKSAATPTSKPENCKDCKSGSSASSENAYSENNLGADGKLSSIAYYRCDEYNIPTKTAEQKGESDLKLDSKASSSDISNLKSPESSNSYLDASDCSKSRFDVQKLVVQDDFALYFVSDGIFTILSSNYHFTDGIHKIGNDTFVEIHKKKILSIGFLIPFTVLLLLLVVTLGSWVFSILKRKKARKTQKERGTVNDKVIS